MFIFVRGGQVYEGFFHEGKLISPVDGGEPDQISVPKVMRYNALVKSNLKNGQNLNMKMGQFGEDDLSTALKNNDQIVLRDNNSGSKVKLGLLGGSSEHFSSKNGRLESGHSGLASDHIRSLARASGHSGSRASDLRSRVGGSGHQGLRPLNNNKLEKSKKSGKSSSIRFDSEYMKPKEGLDTPVKVENQRQSEHLPRNVSNPIMESPLSDGVEESEVPDDDPQDTPNNLPDSRNRSINSQKDLELRSREKSQKPKKQANMDNFYSLIDPLGAGDPSESSDSHHYSSNYEKSSKLQKSPKSSNRIPFNHADHLFKKNSSSSNAKSSPKVPQLPLNSQLSQGSENRHFRKQSSNLSSMSHYNPGHHKNRPSNGSSDPSKPYSGVNSNLTPSIVPSVKLPSYKSKLGSASIKDLYPGEDSYKKKQNELNSLRFSEHVPMVVEDPREHTHRASVVNSEHQPRSGKKHHNQGNHEFHESRHGSRTPRMRTIGDATPATDSPFRYPTIDERDEFLIVDSRRSRNNVNSVNKKVKKVSDFGDLKVDEKRQNADNNDQRGPDRTINLDQRLKKDEKHQNGGIGLVKEVVLDRVVDSPNKGEMTGAQGNSARLSNRAGRNNNSKSSKSGKKSPGRGGRSGGSSSRNPLSSRINEEHSKDGIGVAQKVANKAAMASSRDLSRKNNQDVKNIIGGNGEPEDGSRDPKDLLKPNQEKKQSSRGRESENQPGSNEQQQQPSLFTFQKLMVSNNKSSSLMKQLNQKGSKKSTLLIDTHQRIGSFHKNNSGNDSGQAKPMTFGGVRYSAARPQTNVRDSQNRFNIKQAVQPISEARSITKFQNAKKVRVQKDYEVVETPRRRQPLMVNRIPRIGLGGAVVSQDGKVGAGEGLGEVRKAKFNHKKKPYAIVAQSGQSRLNKISYKLSEEDLEGDNQNRAKTDVYQFDADKKSQKNSKILKNPNHQKNGNRDSRGKNRDSKKESRLRKSRHDDKKDKNQGQGLLGSKQPYKEDRDNNGLNDYDNWYSNAEANRLPPLPVKDGFQEDQQGQDNAYNQDYNNYDNNYENENNYENDAYGGYGNNLGDKLNKEDNEYDEIGYLSDYNNQGGIASSQRYNREAYESHAYGDSYKPSGGASGNNNGYLSGYGGNGGDYGGYGEIGNDNDNNNNYDPDDDYFRGGALKDADVGGGGSGLLSYTNNSLRGQDYGYADRYANDYGYNQGYGY